MIAAVAAIASNVVWVFVATAVASVTALFLKPEYAFNVDYVAALNLLSGESRDITPITDFPIHVLIYFGTLWIASWRIGKWVGQWRVKHSKALSHAFQTGASGWPWIFRAQTYGGETVDVMTVNALVEIGGRVYRYCGILVDFWPNRNGDLDALVLRGVTKIDVLGTEASKQLDVPLFVICHADLRALGIKPVNLKKLDEENRAHEAEAAQKCIRDQQEEIVRLRGELSGRPAAEQAGGDGAL
jgi:hypothetical protein